MIGYSAEVDRLKNEWVRRGLSVDYSWRRKVIKEMEPVQIHGFLGSRLILKVVSKDEIVCNSPSFLAAPLVTNIAMNAIYLGYQDLPMPEPVRIYAPHLFNIITSHLALGDLEFVVEPLHGFLACHTLSLKKLSPKTEDPEWWEMVKSWSANEDMEVRVITEVD